MKNFALFAPPTKMGSETVKRSIKLAVYNSYLFANDLFDKKYTNQVRVEERMS